METSIEHQRLKQIREELNFTQAEFGKQLELTSSTADLERGRTRIPGKAVMILLKEFNINPLWLFAESEQKYLHPSEANVVPKTITLNPQGHENILLVNAKAAAGYGQNIGDAEYIQQLPAFDFPLPEYRNASFRGFQIIGDSMLPLVRSGDWVLAKAVDSFKHVKEGKIYIVVESESIRLKEVKKQNNGKQIDLISWNPEYPTVTISAESVLEMWEYHSRISFGVERIQGLTLETIYNEVQKIKNQIM